MRNYGFIKPEVQATDWIFGDAQIDAPVLQEDGQWDKFLPVDEFQNADGFEVYACATYGTTNCIETLLKRKFDFNENYSDRYVAKMTDTDKIKGNDPHKIAEYIRNYGNVEEYEWPDASATSFEDFYRTPPPPLAVSAKTFIQHYELKHDYVPTDPTSLKNALKYSPLGIAVYAWEQLPNGLYKAATDDFSQNHWVCLYGYEDGVAWHVFDSYDSSHKRIEWAHKPAVAKRYHIDLAPQTQSLIDALLTALKGALASLKNLINPPMPTPEPSQDPAPVSEPTPKLLIPFCEAIKTYEGYYPTSRSYRNNNPGNLRYASQPGTKGRDAQGFAIFTSYQAGWIALVTMVQNAASGKSTSYKPSMSIKDFFRKYAPSSDNNNPDAYALYVAKRLGVEAATYKISNLV